jgi:hypothetical protein
VPTVQATGKVTDGAGRVGIELRSIREDQDRDRLLILDPRSFELLGAQTVALDALASRLGVPTGAVTENTVILERAATDQIQAP